MSIIIEELVLQHQQTPSDILFEQIADGCESSIKFCIRKYYWKDSEPDDVRQECLISLIKSIRTWKAERGSNFRSFSSLVMRRHCISVAKHYEIVTVPTVSIEPYEVDTNEDTYLYCDYVFTELIADQKSYLDTAIDQEKFDLFQRMARESLTPIEWDCHEADTHGYTLKEIGEMYGVETKAVDNALSRARPKCRKIISEIEGEKYQIVKPSIEEQVSKAKQSGCTNIQIANRLCITPISVRFALWRTKKKERKAAKAAASA